ncbi:MAG: drug/metabolite transporter, family [Thermoleophilaceae bacterium]|nr:drug/metabolite transporter, family [Thermoleophilaceae bacterium]
MTGGGWRVASGGAGPQRLVLLSAFLFGTTGTAQALGPDGTTPITVGAVRIAVGGAVLVVVALATGALRSRRRWPAGAVAASALGVAGYQLCFFAAVDATGVALGTVVALGSGPAFAGLFGLLLRRERPARRWAAATALAVTGAALLVLAGGDAASVDPGGVALALGAGASYGLYTVTSKTLLDAGQRPEAVMAVAFAAGAILLVPVLALGDTAWLAHPGGIALAAYLGLIPTALAYVLFARGLERLPAATVATLTLAEPLTAALLGILVLGERPGPVAIVGALLVLSGLLVLARSPASASASASASGSQI